MTHQTLSLEKYWKLFPATLNVIVKNLSTVQINRWPLNRGSTVTCDKHLAYFMLK